MADPRYTDGFISPTGATAWKFTETGPGHACSLTPAQMTDTGAKLRVRKTTSTVSYSWASNPPADLSPTYWSNFSSSLLFPIRDKDATTAATVVWAGVYPTNLRMLVVVWDGPVKILDRTKILGAIVSSVEGRVMHLLLPSKVAIDGSTSSTVTFKAGSVGVTGLVKDTNLSMYSTPPVASSAVLLAADTLNDTTDVTALQDSATKNAYIQAFYGTFADIPVTAQCWQQFELQTVYTCASTAVLCPPWMLCYNLWGTTTPMDLFPPEQLLYIADIGHFGAGTFTARLTTTLSAGTTSSLAVEVMGAAGPPVPVTWPVSVTYTPSPTGGSYTDSIPPKTMVTLTVCAAANLDGNSQPVAGGGGGTTAIASAIVYGGDCVQTASPFAYDKPDIYSLARFPSPLDPAKPVDWTKLDLPITFNHGDPIPQRTTAPVVTPTDAKWPNGVGLARLCRGSPAVGTSSWDADVYTATPLVAYDSVPYYAGFKSPSQSVAYVYFDKPPVAVDATQICMVNSGVPTADVVSSAIISNSTVIVTFTAAVVITSTRSIRFKPNGVTTRTVVDSSGTSTNFKNTTNIDVPLNIDPSNVPWMIPVGPVTTVKAIDAIYDPANPTMLSIYYSGRLSTAPPASGNVSLSPAGTMTVSGGVINGTDTRRVDYTLSTPTDADLAGTVVVSVGIGGGAGATLAQGDIPSGPTIAATPFNLHVKAAKNCYVLVCNRYTETPYYRGDVIDVAVDAPFSLNDTQSTPNTRTVYDSRIREIMGPDQQVLVVIGGNAAAIGNSMNGIVYSSSITPTAAFNPNVDTVYDNGLGYGDLWTGGLYTGRVLIRHNYLGHPYPIIAGTKLRVATTATLNYDPGGGSPLVPMLVYMFDWL